MDPTDANRDRAFLSPRVLASNDAEVSPRRRELRRVADATRALIEHLVGTDKSEEELARAADAIEELAARFDEDGPHSVYDGFAESSISGGAPIAFFDHSPFIGRGNPLAPPITLEVTEDRVLGHVVFGSAYEGPPGCVHGGYVAAAFDELLGATQTFSGTPGMTGTLTVVYRSPTPLHTELTLEGRYLRTEGRKVFTEGTMKAGDVLTAEANAIFVSIPAGRFLELIQQREADRRPTDPPPT
jgi:acyl-coenzyme A thioesterase PaaI-like protein